MLAFVTDVRTGETDILASVCREELRVKQFNGQLIEALPAPNKDWTHEALEAVAKQLATKTGHGAEAYLGSCWVGSTEV